ncbi:GNAT family N-acetyltransferase [Paenibacillus lautus]|uniref:GNAT family N-acetyltransferase n=1 Tax=Paenibacillus lautus TaxID=1401 RepID=UPI000BBD9A08|nr:GNAT family N-acetyltransferase [Paenibacillus lautus]PCL95024.1 GNAT family N-acetyltransferase [Paenibacillus lautus]
MNPILIDFPNQFTTERLLIRAPLPGDGRVVYESIFSSINELKEWFSLFAQNEHSEQSIEAILREEHAKFIKREYLRLLIFDKETEQFIGLSGLYRPDWEIRKFEIGYWIDTRMSGKGYMTEAVQGITNFAFTELKARRVEIRCDTLNYKSKAIPERLGFQLEGTLRCNDLSADKSQIRDTHIYALVK